jgi:hypothetical protein
MEHVKWSLTNPYLYEVERERKHRAGPLGLSDVNETAAPVSAAADASLTRRRCFKRVNVLHDRNRCKGYRWVASWRWRLGHLS